MITAFSKGDTAALHAFVHRSTGVYYVERTGVYDRIEHDAGIDRGYAGSMTYEDFLGITIQPIVYAELPKYGCDAEAWSKTGTFADTIHMDSLMTRTAQWQNTYDDEKKYSQGEIDALTSLEAKSHKVIVALADGRSLAFSLSYIDGKWWLTIMDFVTGDCSV